MVLQGIHFEYPYVLFSLIPGFIILFLIIRTNFVKRLKRSDVKKTLIKKRFLILLSRSLIITCLVIAIASPFLLKTEIKEGVSSVIILTDNSTSMNAMDTSKLPALYESLEKQFPVETRTIASGTRSAIGEAVLSALTPNSNIILATDGNTNYGRSIGDALISSKTTNSTINAVNLGEHVSDTSVRIEGSRTTTNAKGLSFDVITNQIGEKRAYDLQVTLNGQLAVNRRISGSQVLTIEKKFKEGRHEIKARIVINDYFEQNNEFSKSITVEEKPSVLFVSKKRSPLTQILNNLYFTTTVSSMEGQNLNDYSAVILNDIPEKDVDAKKLREYVTEGNGLVVFGGKDSYDRGNYEGSEFESILPIRIGRGSKTEDTETNVLLLIDISGSTKSNFKRGSRFEVSEVEKALALSVLSDLEDEDYISVLAFNTNSYLIHELSKVEGNREEIKEKISRLNYYGGTSISEGIRASRKVLGPLRGSKSIIIFSDGRSGSIYEDTKQAAQSARIGVKVYAVGVGEDTDRNHLIKIAKEGEGLYLEPDETEKLAIVLGEPEEDSASDLGIEIINNYHFITYNFKPDGSVNGFNHVVPKLNSELLVATKENNPLITSSRIGLGRIVAVSTDDGSAWASQMLTSKNSGLISRSINWAIGDLNREKDYYVDLQDSYVGVPSEIRIISDTKPEHESLSFSKIGPRLYSAHFTPKDVRKQEFFGTFAFTNYADEYTQLGMNSDFKEAVENSGGKLFNPEDANLLIQKIEQESKRTVSDPEELSWIFLGIVLVIFLVELIIRNFSR